jgi:hypothetical protein
MTETHPTPTWVGIADCGCVLAAALSTEFDPRESTHHPAFRALLADLPRPIAVWVLIPTNPLNEPAWPPPGAHPHCRRTEALVLEPAIAVVVPKPVGCSPSCSEGHTYEPPCSQGHTSSATFEPNQPHRFQPAALGIDVRCRCGRAEGAVLHELADAAVRLGGDAGPDGLAELTAADTLILERAARDALVTGEPHRYIRDPGGAVAREARCHCGRAKAAVLHDVDIAMPKAD